MIRVQQQRGVKLPEGVRSVARPSRWGNPCGQPCHADVLIDMIEETS